MSRPRPPARTTVVQTATAATRPRASWRPLAPFGAMLVAGLIVGMLSFFQMGSAGRYDPSAITSPVAAVVPPAGASLAESPRDPLILIQMLDEMLLDLVRFPFTTDELAEFFADAGTKADAGVAFDGFPAPNTPADGGRVDLAAGVHVVDFQRWPRMVPLPSDLLVVGAGMDETLLQISEISVRTPVDVLTFQDLTIDCRSGSFTDLRQSPALLRFVRCRLIGYDSGAGGSVLFDVEDAIIWAEDCRFEAGFGRGQQDGTLIRVGGTVIARFDRCTFTGGHRELVDRREDGAFLFDACTFDDITTLASSAIRTPAPPIYVEHATIIDPAAQAGVRMPPANRRTLDELNPDWAP